MAKLFIKQKVFSWKDKFFVYDEMGNEKYSVKGEIISLGKKLHIYDMNENELAFIHQKVLSFKARYFIDKNGTDVAEVVKEITLLKPKYTINGFNWKIEGDFLAHNYQIVGETGTVATISKKWLSWGDTYEIDFSDSIDPVDVLAVVIVIDAIIAQQATATAAFAAST